VGAEVMAAASQSEYESALGAFLVAFNGIENATFEMMVLALKKAGLKEIPQWIDDNSFDRKMQYLTLISLRFPEIASPELISELRALAGERNKLAHGHFDQNPADDSYVVVARRKMKQTYLDVPTENIDALTRRARKAEVALRRFFAFYWHEEIAP
jgi:hypothetical protein